MRGPRRQQQQQLLRCRPLTLCPVWFHTPQQGKIKSLESIYLFSMPVKEYQIVEYFLGSALKDEVMKIMPVQKQTRAGQRTRFKVRVVCCEGAAVHRQQCAGTSERVESKRQLLPGCKAAFC